MLYLFLIVLEFCVTLFKSERWWAAVAVLEAFGRKSIVLYLWQRRGDAWKHRQKFVFRSKDEWVKVRGVVDSLVGEL